jgi:pimeloyl-ACP methyl ester carboxylesterase
VQQGQRAYQWVWVRVVALVIVVLVGVFGPRDVSARVAHAQDAYTPRFEPTACTFDTLLPLPLDDATITCGYVVVPEQHANPQGPTIRLAVVILKSLHPDPVPDPLILAQGGPGGSTIETYTTLLRINPRVRTSINRDIVLFDQRGTLYSEPSLACPEVLDVTIATIDQTLPEEEEEGLYQQALEACRTRLVDAGVNLSAFNSLENAADIDDVRRALGYEQINLYGVSYGTLLALHTMRDHPQALRSVILDAVVPPQINFLTQAPRSMDRSFDALFKACQADAECHAAYPDLEQVIVTLIARLNENPARVPMTDMETGKTYEAVVDGDMFQSGLFQMLYSSDVLPALPMLISDVQAGEYAVFGRIMSMVVFERSVSYGMYYSVLCAEDADFTVNDLALSDVRPWLAEGEADEAAMLLEVCNWWNVDTLGARVDAPVVSDIPTLILSGRFDPITPPAFGEEAAQTLNHSYTYTFLHTGHGVAFQDECADQIIFDFLNNPALPPDGSCIAEHPAPTFFTPANVFVTPDLLRFANLEGTTLLSLGLFAIGLLVVLSVVLVWPLVWLIRLFMKQERTAPPLLARVVVWLSGLNGVVLAGFLVGLLWMVFELALSNDAMILFGVPASWGWLFLLPLLSVALSLVMLVGSVQSWREGFWSLAERIYYALITLAALVCVGVVASWGLLGVVVL